MIIAESPPIINPEFISLLIKVFIRERKDKFVFPFGFVVKQSSFYYVIESFHKRVQVAKVAQQD